MLSAGQIIGGAFALVRERFGSVLVWGLLYSLGAFALGYFMMSAMAPMMTMDENADPASALGAVGTFFGVMLLLYFGSFCLYAVLLTAAQRAVLRPEESGFAYLRFGGDELRAIGLCVILGILFTVVYFIAAMTIGLLAVAVGFGAGAGAGTAGAGAGIGIVLIVGILATLCLLLFLWVRMSLAFPLTLLRGRIMIAEAWRLSRGHFWPMAGAYIALTVIVIVVAVIVSLPAQGGYWAQLMSGTTDPAAQMAQMQAQYSLGVPMMLSFVAGIVIGGLTIALTGGALASAARSLVPAHEGVAETFA